MNKDDILYDAGWTRTPNYGPRPDQWWREWREEDDPELAERCYFGGPPVIWAEDANRAIEIDGFD